VSQGRSLPGQQKGRALPVQFAVLEPGTTSLRLLVVEALDGRATVLGWAEGLGWAGLVTDPQSLMGTCERALAQAEEAAHGLCDRWILPDQIVVGLPASQLRGRAWTVAQRRPRSDRPVAVRELEALLERALRLAINRLRSDHPDDSGWLLVDAALVSLTVDGSGVTDPVGFRGREIGATVFAALARSELIQMWGRVARHLEFSALMLTATPVALVAGLTVPQGILVDVGGKTTDLISCRAGRPTMLDSLPTGGAALTRSLVRQWNLAPDRAEELKRAYSGGRLPAEAKAQIREALVPGLQAWLGETEAAMARLNQDEVLAPHLYVLGGGGALPGVIEAVRSLAWSPRLHFARYPEVRRFRPTDVPGVVNRTGLGQGMGDVSALALAAWAAQVQRAPARPARILSELCQG
jgi:hypothetical protein